MGAIKDLFDLAEKLLNDKNFKLSADEIKILQAIGKGEGESTLQLSKNISAGKQKTQYILDRLRDKGYVKCPKNPGQYEACFLTKKGWLAEAGLLD